MFINTVANVVVQDMSLDFFSEVDYTLATDDSGGEQYSVELDTYVLARLLLLDVIDPQEFKELMGGAADELCIYVPESS